jgi:hypothetical protein
LKDGLVDAQIHSAQLKGSMSDSHPSVLAGKQAEAEIAHHLSAELDAAIRGVEVEVHLSSERTEAIQRQLVGAQQRLDRLAKVRADYANLAAEVRRRSDTLRSVETQLAEAQASQAASHTASLLSRVDLPDTGANPIGLGRITIMVVGCVGGFLGGLGLLFLTVPPSLQQGEPCTATNSWLPFAAPRVAVSTAHTSPIAVPAPVMTSVPMPIITVPTLAAPVETGRPGGPVGGRFEPETVGSNSNGVSSHGGSLTFKEALAKIDQGKRRPH